MVASTKSGQPLTSLKPGMAGFVAKFTDQFIGGKLLSMGILPGSRVELVRRSPFGGSIYARVDNALVALRREEAACIILR